MGSTLTSVVLPISLAVVMFGLGLSLTVADCCSTSNLCTPRG
jgi:hypothetical protein